ncbi:MAG: polysaccharide export protein [Parashewanella sp.]
MKNNNKIIFVLFSSLLISACSIPGQSLQFGSEVVTHHAAGETKSPSIHVYQVNSKIINELRTNPIASNSNSQLEIELNNYQYKIGIADVLNITIWDHPELTIPAGSYRSASESGQWVHADGKIFYPYIGFVTVAGKTVTQIRADVTKKLAHFIESPQVDVNVAAFRSQKAYITGEVNKPGKQPITNVPLTLLDAINQAGGLSANADWRNVVITHNGKDRVVSVYALMQQGDLTQNQLLRDGDIVHVPRNDAQKVFIMGEVKNPQTLKIDRAGMSLTEAISSAGGLSQMQADATGIFVIRSSDKGNNNEKNSSASVYQFNINQAASLILGTEFKMNPYDIVFVTTAPIAQWNKVVSQLVPTIAGVNNLTDAVNTIRNF